MPAPPSSPLLRVLTKPSKLVSTLNWKAAKPTATSTMTASINNGRWGGKSDGFFNTSSSSRAKQPSILTMDIRREWVDLAVASHPKTTPDGDVAATIRVSESVPRSELPQRLAQLLAGESNHEQQNIIGVVVAWPLQYDTGRVGAACGRVLHTLEFQCGDVLLTGKKIQHRKPLPLCLWTPPELYAGRCTTEDKYGRSPLYARATRKIDRDEDGEYIYSSFRHDHTVFDDYDDHGATTLWLEFCHAYWPEYCDEKLVSSSPSTWAPNSLKPKQSSIYESEDVTRASAKSGRVGSKRSLLNAMSSGTVKQCLIQV